MNWFVELASNDPLIALIMVILVYYLLKSILRTINITVRGWPTQPLMDADGDIIHPSRDD